MRKAVLFVFFFACGVGTTLSVIPYHPQPIQQTQAIKPQVSPVQEEKDEIYNLVAYSLVLKHWQTENDRPGRGHNIGAILVDPNSHIIHGNLNCNFVNRNTTQHAEVRTITTFLKKNKAMDLDKHTIYTTLEPCAMCSGMMTQSKVARVVYGQTDPGFGKALERLQLDSRALPNGFPPYPRPVWSQPSQSPIRIQLDVAYMKVDKGLTEWLRGEEAHKIYESAKKRLANYNCAFVENKAFLTEAQDFVKNWQLEE